MRRIYVFLYGVIFTVLATVVFLSVVVGEVGAVAVVTVEQAPTAIPQAVLMFQ